MTTKQTSILVIEDDSQIRRFLKVGLESNDYHYDEVTNGKEGLSEIATRNPDLVILDLGLPDMDGLAFLKQVREWSRVPVIVLTARDREQDKVEALDLGADDYLTKPFGIAELLARIRVALRHSHKEADKPIFENGSLKIDYIKRHVFMKDKEVHLTPTEYKILVFLAKNAGKVITQHQLLKEVWGPTYTEQGHYLRVHMHQLRHKIEEKPTRPKILINEPGVGYRMKIDI
ncbi:MAG: response regulator [Deltaproteobacteria bacterium]|nr:MAG: response regulator [Deltaproteobacteria bacterium]